MRRLIFAWVLSACGEATEPATWIERPTVVVYLPEPFEAQSAFDAWAVTGVLPGVALVDGSGPGEAQNGISEIYFGETGIGPTGERRLGETYWWTEYDQYIEADIILDTLETRWAVVDECPEIGVYDLPSILTHEIGHFWGLRAESENSEATMFGETRLCETKKRDLHEEDIRRIEEIYR